MSNIKNFQSWIKNPEFKYYHYSLASLLISCVLFFIFIFVNQGDWIKVAGVIYQLIGICVIFIGLTERVALFGESSIFKSIGNYFSSIFKKTRVTFKLKNEYQTLRSVTEIEPTAIKEPEEDIRAVILWAKTKFEDVEKKISDNKRAMNKEFQTLANRLEESDETFKKEIEKIEDKFIEVNIPGAPRELYGIVVLFFGLILSVFPEVFQIIKSLMHLPL